jgi:hypothetical protein
VDASPQRDHGTIGQRPIDLVMTDPRLSCTRTITTRERLPSSSSTGWLLHIFTLISQLAAWLGALLKPFLAAVGHLAKGLHWLAELLMSGSLLGWLLLLVVVLATGYALWRLWDRHLAAIAPQLLRFWGQLRQAGMVSPTEIAGMHVTRDSLPHDPAATATQLLDQGAVREALGLLYRASLHVLVVTHAVPVPKGASENDCLRACEAQAASLLPALAPLTSLWLTAAYSTHPVQPDAVRAILPAFTQAWGQTSWTPNNKGQP